MTRRDSRACARCGRPLDGADECPQCGAPVGAGASWGAERSGAGGGARRRRPAAALTVAGALAVAGAVAALLAVGPLRLPFRPAPAAPPPTPERPALPPAPVAAPEPSAESAPPTKNEIARRAVAASAVVSCDAGLGTAFFVSSDRAITNAHVLCGDGIAKVTLADGRELLGKRVYADEQVDVAVIDVVGAAVPEPLPIGDSTLLSPGDPISLVGNPSGLSFTVHEGRISFVGRNVYGVSYLQLDANVNPGNSGGPLLDARGRAIGIVSMKMNGASGLGLALPIEYARPHAGLPATSPEADARWRDLLSRAEEEDRAAAAKFSKRMTQPTLFSALPAWGGKLTLVVGKRFEGGAYRVPIDVEVQGGGRVFCHGSGRVEEWESLETALTERLRRNSGELQARWALRRGVADGVHVGRATIELEGCKPAEVPERAVVSIRGGEPFDGPVPFPRDGFTSLGDAGRDYARFEESRKTQQKAEREARWRKAFKDAQEEILRLERRRRELTDYLAATPSDYRAREKLAEVEEALPKARTAYDDLERKASYESVPREWRQ